MTPQDQDVDTPLSATANGPTVVITGEWSVAVGMTPEAVLASLAPLRKAAEQAIKNREQGIEPEQI